MRLFLLAYACDPDEGSESGAGWAILRAASQLQVDEIIVLTRERRAPRLERAASEMTGRVTVIRVSTPPNWLPTYPRYIAWVVSARRYVRQHALPGDIVHHATFASDWLPPAFPRAHAATSVWGPAGGNTYPPRAVRSSLSVRFRMKESIRRLSTSAVRQATRKIYSGRVSHFIALNPDSVASAPAGAAVSVHSNCILDYAGLPRAANTRHRLLFVGRLVEWKGAQFAIEMLDHLGPEWSLTIAGAGPYEPTLRRLAERSDHRITFTGRLNRDRCLELMADSTALVLPSLHDSAPWTAAEAAGVGIPVLTTELGGVAMMAGARATVVQATPANTLAARLADAVTELPKNVTPARDWTAEALTAALRIAYGVDRKVESDF